MKILLAGDVHIGRRSSRIPKNFGGLQHSSAQAWLRIVDLALKERVDLVALSGDLVDHENRYFEAYGPLEKGLRRLEEAGVETVAVLGNHDWDTLDRFAAGSGFGRFHVLGQEGRWEDFHLDRGDDRRIRVLGWSFPSGQVFENPLNSLQYSLEDQTPVLGLVHTDLNQAGSPYAPSMLTDFRRFDLSLWVTGHQHKPGLFDDSSGPIVVNTGSPQAMDPGEPGPHGAWIVELLPGRRPKPLFLPLSTVRYERTAVRLEGRESPEEIADLATGQVRKALAKAGDNAPHLELLTLRMSLTGRTPHHHRLAGLLKDLGEDLKIANDRITAVVEKFELETRPAVDLEALAAKPQGLPGLLARLLLDLESGSLLPEPPELTELLNQVHEKTTLLDQTRPYAPIYPDDRPARPDQARDMLLKQGRLLLDALLAQKES